MTVKKICTSRELAAEHAKAGGKLVVVDFSATWCGPCRAIAPVYDRLAVEHPDVVFLQVVHDEGGEELADEAGVRGFPTFQFFLKGDKVDEFSGADPGKLTAKVAELKKRAGPAAFAGTGHSLGGHVARSAEEIRLARLRALGGDAAAATAASHPPPPAAAPAASAPPAARSPAEAPAAAAAAGGGSDAAAAAALRDAARARAAAAAAAAVAAHAPPSPAASFVPKPDVLAQLLEFGMSRERSYRALQATGNGTIDAALDWLTEHQDDATLDAPIAGFSAASERPAVGAHAPAPAPAAAAGGDDDDDDVVMVAAGGAGGAPPTRSAEDSAAIASAQALLDAENTKSGAPARKMTREETEALLLRLRAEKAAKEKEDEKARELKRRTDGKASQDVAEEIIAIQRKREADKLKREHDDKEKERRRLQIELLRDKIERHAARGEPTHELMEQLAVLEGIRSTAKAELPADPAAAVAMAIDALATYKAGLGLTAVQTLRVLLNNPLTTPGDAKFRTINLANEKIRERVTSLRGGLTLLKSVGWVKDDAANTLVLTDATYNAPLLASAVAAIDAAIAAGKFA